MKVRGACGYKVDGKYVIVYNHSDSYPHGLGREVVEVARKILELDINNVKNNVRAVEFIDEFSTAPASLISKYKHFANIMVASGKLSDWYVLLHKVQGAKGLSEIANGMLCHISNAFDFLKDSLNCEYAYVINLDDMKLECYKGRQKQMAEGNPLGTDMTSSGYYPCKLVSSFNLGNIPADWAEQAFPEDYQ